ncbi:MAG: fatty acid desaturase [Burkholderiaceae bacterium]
MQHLESPPSSTNWRWHVLVALVFALSPAVGWLAGAPWAGLVLGAGAIPLLEWWLHGRGGVPGPTWQWTTGWLRGLALAVLVQALALPWLTRGESWATVLWLALAMGYVAGGTGIVLAHELGHRHRMLDKGLARALLVVVGYGHYAIAHNRGHHRHAATWTDPATARRHEGLWRFYLRYFAGVWRQAWRLSAQAPTRWNEAGVLLALWVAWLVVATWLGGTQALMFVLVQAGVAQLLVGAVDYVEHWGLQRRRTATGHERLSHAHVWDCANPVSELLLFNLPRHASHHLQPWRDANSLQRQASSPQMPTGYAGMVLLAMVPPWFRAVMTPRLPTLEPER